MEAHKSIRSKNINEQNNYFWILRSILLHMKIIKKLNIVCYKYFFSYYYVNDVFKLKNGFTKLQSLTHFR